MDIDIYLQAIKEGRCVMIDNTPPDMNAFLLNSLFFSLELTVDHIDMFSHTAPNSSRCYCFVVFHRPEDANRNIMELEGLGSWVGPLWSSLVIEMPTISMRDKFSSYDKTEASDKVIFDPWRWKNGMQMPFPCRNLGGRDGRRVCVGGLPWICNQTRLDVLIREIFKDFDIELVHILESPSLDKRSSEKEHFCFVDLASKSDARAIIKGWNGRPMDWGPLRVTKPMKWARDIGDMKEPRYPIFDEKTARQLQRKAYKETRLYNKIWRKQKLAGLLCCLPRYI